jgi:3',5'-cyclic AMP phosphodiesterase CpdA
MTYSLDRREFLKLAGLGGVVLVGAALTGRSAAADAGDFYFVQLSDTHWGFEGPAQNPDSTGTLKKAIAAVNGLTAPPDFVIFTGDLTHTTEDGKVRRQRMDEVRSIIGELKVKDVKFIPGEHDASLDHGKAFQEFFGATHYTFDHKGVHFIVVDNVSDPGASIGSDQLGWLAADIDRQPKDARIVVFTHRPLFDLYPQWDWATTDGAKAIEILQARDNVTVFYGHIHQEHHFKTGAIEHHAAKGLMFALPAPGSQLKRTPVAWDPAAPYKGLGWREVEAEARPVKYDITELPVRAA